MVDYLDGLQPAGDDGLGFTPEVWRENDDDCDERTVRNRYSPPERPFSSLEEIDNSHDDSVTDTVASSRYTHSPVSDNRIPIEEEYILYTATVPDPIRLRGVGGTTMFGMNNHFEDDFPSHLLGKVAPEEFHETLDYINGVLQKSIPFNLKCLLFGCVCCPCTLGVSLGPVLYLNKRTQTRIVKFMAQENSRLYNKLGLNLKLAKEQCEGTNLAQYVILFEFMPKTPLYRPD